MFDEYNPNVVYRAFDSRFVATRGDGHRLNSATFKFSQTSVYLGSETTLRQVCERHHGQGVAALPLELLKSLNLELRPDGRRGARTGMAPSRRPLVTKASSSRWRRARRWSPRRVASPGAASASSFRRAGRAPSLR
jgi:hypothetical protein